MIRILNQNFEMKSEESFKYSGKHFQFFMRSVILFLPINNSNFWTKGTKI